MIANLLHVVLSERTNDASLKLMNQANKTLRLSLFGINVSIICHKDLSGDIW